MRLFFSLIFAVILTTGICGVQSFSFTPNMYKIIAEPNNENFGTTYGSGNYEHFHEVTLSAMAENGYHFVEWTEDGEVVMDGDEPAGEVNTYTAEQDRNLIAHFAISQYEIIAISSLGGTVDPSGTLTVTHNDDLSFNIAADEGYMINDVLVDSISQGPIETYTFTYTFENVQNNHIIEAVFSPIIRSGSEDEILCKHIWENFFISIQPDSYDQMHWDIAGDAKLWESANPYHVWAEVGKHDFEITVRVVADDKESTGSKNLIVSGDPPEKASIIKKSDNILLVDQSGQMEPYSSFQWGKFNKENFEMTEKGNEQFQYFENGIQIDSYFYWVITTSDDNACSRWSLYNDQETVGLYENSADMMFNIYPNPASQSDHITIAWENQYYREIQVLISDLSGQVVFYEQLSKASHYDTLSLKPGNHPPGLYIITLQKDGHMFHQKLIIK